VRGEMARARAKANAKKSQHCNAHCLTKLRGSSTSAPHSVCAVAIHCLDANRQPNKFYGRLLALESN
jgi:hypothetical protein